MKEMSIMQYFRRYNTIYKVNMIPHLHKSLF